MKEGIRNYLFMIRRNKDEEIENSEFVLFRKLNFFLTFFFLFGI